MLAVFDFDPKGRCRGRVHPGTTDDVGTSIPRPGLDGSTRQKKARRSMTDLRATPSRSLQCEGTDSNRRHRPFQGRALPAELPSQGDRIEGRSLQHSPRQRDRVISPPVPGVKTEIQNRAIRRPSPIATTRCFGPVRRPDHRAILRRSTPDQAQTTGGSASSSASGDN